MKNTKSFLAIAILMVAGLWVGWPENRTDARVAGSETAEQPYEPKPAGTLTFNRDIAPVIFNNCASCHRPGEVAPFSLLGYQDVKKRAKQIAYVSENRIMPPWKADQSDFEFKSDRRLTNEQIGIIKQWAEEGAPEGNLKDLPAMPKFTEG